MGRRDSAHCIMPDFGINLSAHKPLLNAVPMCMRLRQMVRQRYMARHSMETLMWQRCCWRMAQTHRSQICMGIHRWPSLNVAVMINLWRCSPHRRSHSSQLRQSQAQSRRRKLLNRSLPLLQSLGGAFGKLAGNETEGTQMRQASPTLAMVVASVFNWRRKSRGRVGDYLD